MSKALAERQAEQNYPTYAVTYNSPPYSLMIRTGLWLELEVIIAFVFGLGLASLMGQRMVPILLMIVYEIIFRPFLLSTEDSPSDQPSATPGHRTGCGPLRTGRNWCQLRDRERTGWASRLVVLAAGVDCHRGRGDRGLAGGWTVLGAWRMATRDA